MNRFRARPCRAFALLLSLSAGLLPAVAAAQMPKMGPPAVGVVKAVKQPLYRTNDFVGRVQSPQRVALVARVSGVLRAQLFTEGQEVRKGQLLFRLQRGPYLAAVEAARAVIAQAQAQLNNAAVTLARARKLLGTPAGNQSTVDAALAQEQSYAAQVMAGQAQLKTAEINLGYTLIRAPIDGRIGLVTYTPGNVVGPSSQALATIVSQDPMNVLFPIPVTTYLKLRARFAAQGGLKAAAIALVLPDGESYAQSGTIDFVDTGVTQSTDTVLLRGTIPDPRLAGLTSGRLGDRALTDGEFVSVTLKDLRPVEALVVPRAAVLSDQSGNYVFVVGPGNKVVQTYVTLGQSTPSVAAILKGLSAGQEVVVDGIQRVHPGLVVAPGPASLMPGALAPQPAPPAGKQAAGK